MHVTVRCPLARRNSVWFREELAATMPTKHQGVIMTRNRKPEFTSHDATHVVCALAAAAMTWTLFSGVVSVAEAPSMAIAGQRGNQAIVERATTAKLAQTQTVQTAQTVVVSR